MGFRSGTVVHMVSAMRQQVPVKLIVSHIESQDGAQHLVRVTRCTHQDFDDLRRVVVTVSAEGRVIDVSPPKSTVFGW